MVEGSSRAVDISSAKISIRQQKKAAVPSWLGGWSLIIILAVVCACDVIPKSPTTNRIQYYPNALNVQETDNGRNLRGLSFETYDSPVDVLVYYQDFLRQDGWPRIFMRNNEIAADWHNAMHTSYTFNLKITPSNVGPHKVVIIIAAVPTD
jgi:hypothetical protein